MRTISISRPSPATVLASVALFVGLGGTGYAAAKLDGSSIKRGSIPAGKIVPNALGGGQVDEARLGTVPSAQSAQSAVNAENAKNADNAKKADNADNAKQADNATLAANANQLEGRGAAAFMANGSHVVTAESLPVAGPNGPVDLQAPCAANEKAIGGGAAWIIPGTGDPSALEVPITASMPVVAASGEAIGWHGAGRNMSATNRILRVFAICVPKTA